MSTHNQPTAAQVLGRVTLVTGKEEFLSVRTVRAVRDAVVSYDAESEYSECPGADLTMAGLAEMSAPSLFSTLRCVVVRSLQDVEDQVADGLLEYADAPVEDIALVLVHDGGQKGSRLLKGLRQRASVTEIKTPEVKYASGFADFVKSEVSLLGSRIAGDAAGFLVQAVGQDLRSLAAACHQLASDCDGQAIGLAEVQRYFGGRAEAKSFAVADAAFAGRRAMALEELRWALDAGTAPVLVTSAFAGSARSIAKMLGAPRGLREADLARELGVPPWKVKSVRDQSRSWSEQGIGAALRAIASADAGIKGAAHDASYTLERLVLSVVAYRSAR